MFQGKEPKSHQKFGGKPHPKFLATPLVNSDIYKALHKS